METGLYKKGGEEQLPLVNVDIKCLVVDVFEEIIVRQKYVNNEDVPLEVTYHFDAGKWATQGFLGDFTAEIDGRRYAGSVKEKEAALDKYEDAVASGQTAGIVHKKKDGGFVSQLGNLPPKTECTIEITFCTQVTFGLSGERLLTIPTCLFPTLTLEQGFLGCTAHCDVRVTGGIKSVECEEYPMKVERQEDKTISVSVNLGKEIPSADVILKVLTANESEARGWLDCSLDNKVTSAAVVIQPHKAFEKLINDQPPKQILFVLDCSYSMESHGRIKQSKDAMTVFLKSLPIGVYFNLIQFGDKSKILWKGGSHPYDPENSRAAQQFVDEMRANLGCTNMVTPLQDAFRFATKFNKELNGGTDIMILTDGFVDDPAGTLKVVTNNKLNARVSVVGLGNDCSFYQVRTLAHEGGGLAEFAPDNDAALTAKIQRLFKATKLPSISEVSVKWKCDKQTDLFKYLPETTKYPVFLGSAITQFALFNDSVEIPKDSHISCELTAVGPPPELQKMKFTVNCDQLLNIDIDAKGIVSRLAANDIIRTCQHRLSPHIADQREWPDQAKLKSKIVELALKYKIATQYTSFVCVAETDNSVSGAMKSVQILPPQAHHAAPSALGRGSYVPAAFSRQSYSDDDDDDGDDYSESDGEKCENEDECEDRMASACADGSSASFDEIMDCAVETSPHIRNENNNNNRCKRASSPCLIPPTAHDEPMFFVEEEAKMKMKPEQPKQKPLPSVVEIAQVQDPIGYWEASDKALGPLGYKLSQVLGSKDGSVADVVWVTCVVLAYLEVKLRALSEEWELIAEKAKDWLKGKGVNVVAQLNIARSFVKTQ